MKRLNPHISIDCVVFGFDYDSLKVLLIERDLTSKTLKLPGNLIADDEDLDTSARKTLNELTGLNDIYLKQFKVFDSPSRISNNEDLVWLQQTSGLPVDRIISVAYYSLIQINKEKTFSDKSNLHWMPLNKLNKLAFDHKQIINEALKTLRNTLKTEPIAFEMLPKKFTLTQMQTLYEIILNTKLDNRNFRKKIKKLEYIVALNEKQLDVAHKPARFFKFDKQLFAKHKKKTMLYTV
jgi:8-oxo-dGTP diphosphatase